MKSFQPKAEGNPSGVDGTNDPPGDAAGSGPGGAAAAGAETGRPSDASEHTTPEPLSCPAPAAAATSKSFGHSLEPSPIGLEPMAPRWATPSDNGDHASVTDPDAQLFRKSQGTGAILCHMGHALMVRGAARHRFEACAERQRPRRPGRADPGRWPCRTPRGTRHDPPPVPGLYPPPHAGHRQGLRQRRLRRRSATTPGPGRNDLPDRFLTPSAAPPATTTAPRPGSTARRSRSLSAGARPSEAWRRQSERPQTGEMAVDGSVRGDWPFLDLVGLADLIDAHARDHEKLRRADRASRQRRLRDADIGSLPSARGQ